MADSRTRTLVAASAALLVAALVSGGCGGSKPVTEASGGAAAPVEGTGSPDFILEDLGGAKVRLADAKGTVVLVDFWATWCAPCREEIPMFKDLHKTYGGKGFTLLTIAMDDEGKTVVEPYVKENGLDYPVLLGTPETGEAFGGLVGFPTKFLLDRDGKVVARWIGPVPRPVLEGKIKELMSS